MTELKTVETYPFLRGGGEMGALIRSRDWSDSAVGAPHTWPESLRTTISILLNSQFPMFIWWGTELITFYNDAYRVIAGEKHPHLLGRSGRDMWAEIWLDLQPLVESVFAGTSTWSEDQLLYLNRHDYVEETYFTFSYSPVLHESGDVAGLFCACIETTGKVLGARRAVESERNLRNTILQAPVAMCILRGPSFIVDIANERMFTLWGRSAEMTIDRPIFDALPEARNQGLEKLLRDVYRTGETFTARETPVLLPRNDIPETRYLNFVYQPFRDGNGNISGVIAVALDVTEQVIARQTIEQSEQELQQKVEDRTRALEEQRNLLDNILTNSSNGISVTEMIRDEKGAIYDANTILANDAAIRYVGLPREIYLGRTAAELDPNILSSPYGQTCLKTLETGLPSIIQYYMEISGRWLELTLSRMDEDHLIHIFTDVTSIKESQLELERTIGQLKRSNANLEEFAYAASHDMKEPIRKIHIFSDILQRELEGQLNENQTRLFTRMQNAVSRMSTLIDDLLAYSQATKGVADLERINLNKKVELVLEDLELEIQDKNAAINVGSLPVVTGNRRQLQQLFQNLISNALKYGKPGIPPQVDISSRLVWGKDVTPSLAQSESGKEFHLIQVKDNGIGFEQADADRIFNVFTRLHGNTQYKGSGVGLSIVRKVAENLHGHAWAESQPGEGSTFNILLPVTAAEVPAGVST